MANLTDLYEADMSLLRGGVLHAAALVALIGQASAKPAPQAGAVEGEIALPPGGVEEPPGKYLGFVARIKNPITELRPYDPRPECFVYLDGGPAAPEASRPAGRPVVWELGSASFLIPVLPVVAGAIVDIKNIGKNTHPVTVPANPELFPGPPMGPGGVRSAQIKTPGVAIRLTSPDAPHLEGRIVALPTRYFSRIGRDGSFKIDDVPPGKWTLRIWYRDGWLPTTQVVDVGAKTPRVRITLPERLEPKNAAPAPAQAPPPSQPQPPPPAPAPAGQ